jgi:xylulokinase
VGKRLLLGIDIGTSGCKMTIFDYDGQVVASVMNDYRTEYPYPGYVEQDPHDWWDAICHGSKTMLNEYKIDPREIAAIGVDGHSWACLPVDREGMPLRKAMIWLDRRAVKQANWMNDMLGEARLISTSGNPVDAAYIVPKILWLKENEPNIYRNTSKFLQSNAFIVFKLTDAYSQDYSQGYGFHFFDISRGTWDESIASELGISLDLMAPLCHCHEVVGTVTSKASEDTGLCEDTPVVAGGLDAACCTLGAGVVCPAQTQEQGGQAGGMSILLDRPLIHPKLILGYHVLPDKWLLQGGTVGGSGTLRWFNQQLGYYEQLKGTEQGVSPYVVMDWEAEQVSPGSDGLIFLPYMAGERSPLWDSKARGVFFGLSYDKTRAHLIRAAMEGVGYSLLHNLRTAEEVGANVTELISVGGASNSRLWTQIKADIVGRPIHVPFSDHATTLGVAILAGVGIGVYDSFAEAVERTVHIQRTHMPDDRNHTIYASYYELYIELYQRLKDCYGTLDEIAREYTKREG